MFLFRTSKKELDITDALKSKEAKITIGGKPVVIKALKLAQAVELLAALGNAKEIIQLASADLVAFNRLLLIKLPQLLKFCVPGEDIDPDQVTLAEFADFLLAVYCVNDLDRILGNFYKAITSLPKLTQVSAGLPKQ